ncbi:uncharacterized protein DS421_12g373600 [Arachis hypogaea]|nr:uncharacterized protein DS421_12g373600 [Arachis hypogaea]
MARVIMKCLKGHERVTESKWLWCLWENVKLWALYVYHCAGTPVCMEWLPGESGTCFSWRISACKYLQRSCSAYFRWRISACKRLKPCRGYAAGMPYLTCESDCVGCGSKPTNELITCDRTRYASSLFAHLHLIVFAYLVFL